MNGRGSGTGEREPHNGRTEDANGAASGQSMAFSPHFDAFLLLPEQSAVQGKTYLCSHENSTAFLSFRCNRVLVCRLQHD